MPERPSRDRPNRDRPRRDGPRPERPRGDQPRPKPLPIKDPNEPLRNLSVFDGLNLVNAGNPTVTIPVSGFQTPLAGPVRTRLGFVVLEGDRGTRTFHPDMLELEAEPAIDWNPLQLVLHDDSWILE